MVTGRHRLLRAPGSMAISSVTIGASGRLRCQSTSSQNQLGHFKATTETPTVDELPSISTSQWLSSKLYKAEGVLA